MQQIDVEARAPDPGIVPDWNGLITRAAPNVFMHPVALHAAHAGGFARVHMLLAWGDAPRRLVGLWALQEPASARLWPTFLDALPYRYAFVSNPVIDPDFVDAVMPAFFDAIERAPALPNVLRFKALDGGAPTYAAIRAALAARLGQTLMLAEAERPYVTQDFGVKHTGATRKKLRQDFNRLAAEGAVEVANSRALDDVHAAFEIFLNLEAAGWKGSRGTALLSHAKDAAFARRLIGDLAARGCASVALLRVDGKPIAAQVMLYCGTMAYTWKTGYDAAFARFSPGALLIDKVTELLLASGVTAIESCSPPGGFMAQLWSGRRKTVDLLADVGARKSLGFAMTAMGERGYAQLKGLRKRLRAMQG